MCAFMLQTLSSNKDYSTKLNKPFTTHASLPSLIRLYAFNGTYADFLIISIFRLIATTQGKLATLYPALILTISNISPYLTHLGVTTSTKLLNLFHSMASPTFILADENNYILTSYLLEAFNNIIHFQYAENPNLIYAIVLHHQDFEKLDSMTFASAVTQQMERAARRNSKEEQTVTKEATSEVNDTEQQKDADNGDQQGESSDQQKDADKEETPTWAQVVKKEIPQQDAVPSKSSEGSITTIRPTRNGFIPSEAWMTYLKTKLPLGTIIALLRSLVPQVEERSVSQNNIEDLMTFLKSVSLDDAIQSESSIFIRKFQWGEALVIWFRSMMWGQNYVSNLKDYGPWNGTHVKLFQIKEEQ